MQLGNPKPTVLGDTLSYQYYQGFLLPLAACLYRNELARLLCPVIPNSDRQSRMVIPG
jgi:hypothetical protein